MRRFLLDTGIAGDFVDRRRGTADSDLADVPELPVENWAI
jgi:hypothetical protein